MKEWLKKNQKFILPLVLGVCIIIGAVYWYFMLLDESKIVVNDFKSCSEANGGVVNKSYPAKCTYDGVTYTEDVSIIPDEDTNQNNEGINLDLPESEKPQIEAWLEENNYNQYGDSTDTIYMGGTPLFDESKGTYIKLYDYLIRRHPDKPWLKSSNITENSNNNSNVKSFATVKVWKNFEDPNFELQYPDFVTMANQNGYPVKFTTEDDFEFVIYIDAKAPNYTTGDCEKKLDIGDEFLYLCYNKTIAYQEIYQRMLDSFVIR